jgi:hypothetical protein
VKLDAANARVRELERVLRDENTCRRCGDRLLPRDPPHCEKCPSNCYECDHEDWCADDCTLRFDREDSTPDAKPDLSTIDGGE